MKLPFNLKFRSLPNSDTFLDYFDVFVRSLGFILVYNFIYICLFANDFRPVFPIWFFLATVYLFVSKYNEIEQRKKTITREDLKDLLIDMRIGQLQSFKEKLEDRPEFLRSSYKGRSLLYWSKKYSDQKANKLIIDLMKRS